MDMDLDTDSMSNLSFVAKLLDDETIDDLILHYKQLLPELIHQAGEIVEDSDIFEKRKYLVACSKLLLYNKFLRQHVEPWLCKLGAPWTWSQLQENEPFPKKAKFDPEEETKVLAACYNLLKACERLKESWSWAEIFPMLTSSNAEAKFIVIEILRIIFHLSESNVGVLRAKFLPDCDAFDFVLKYHVVPIREAFALGADSQQLPHEVLPCKVSSLGCVSLAKSDHDQVPCEGSMVEVASTKLNLECVGAAVSVGQPVLIVGDVGVGKTSLVMEWGARTGHQVVTLQVSDSTDARLLVGVYRCTEIPGQFVWEPGLLTRAVLAGDWLLIEDIDRASQDVISLLAPLVQEGQLNVPSLGGLVSPAPGFQLFLTQRDQCHGGVREDLAKLVTTVTVQSLSQEELRQIIGQRYPTLTGLTEKILRLFEMMVRPGDHIEFSDINRLHYVMTNSRQVSVRDLVRWCTRAEFVITQSEGVHAWPELMYQDAVDIFSRFIPDLKVRSVVAEEIAFTFNISKDRAAYFTSTHKPNVSLKQSGLQVGRVMVSMPQNSDTFSPINSVFSITRHAANLLESVARAVACNEPVLLVGETGVGKTTSVQFLAEKTGRKLRVVNMNQQSDSADLLGGFKPVSLQRSLHKLRETFTQVFCDTFSSSNNAKFLGHLDTCFNEERWSDAVQLMSHTLKAAINKVRSDKLLFPRWKEVKSKLKTASEMVKRTDLATVFAFIEGILTEAIKSGDWILLDEVNMAPASVLECLSQLLDNNGSVTLYEAGDHKSIPRHPGFRLFACMNPATDTGKADLAPGLRNRFTEIYCDEMSSKEDISMLVTDYLTNLSLPAARISSIVTFYIQAKLAAENNLTNGQGQRPTFSLRTLCRALKIASRNPCGSVKRSLYEAFSLAFLTELDRSSYPAVRDLIIKHVTGLKETDKVLKQPILKQLDASVSVSGFWIKTGSQEPTPQSHYIMTDTVEQNLNDLARIVSMCEHPVLIQGDTSVGKTSLVTYLASLTGNKVVRVNNHEHTDIQEYVGSYTSDASGKLVFKHGVLAEAMKHGHWVILDELNLAPTDVLEALNRVLDDNRELFIPETGETIRATDGFRLFGTQNPPGTYGGRKVLSRAFKNRFIELHFDQLPAKELEIILTGRCSLPATYSKKMVATLKDLQKYRKGSAAFAGKEGFITLRDLFRWAERYRKAENKEGFYDWDQHLAEEGFMILAARVRKEHEVGVIKDILGKIFKRTIVEDDLFSLSDKTSSITKPILEKIYSSRQFPGVAWTLDMRRLAVLLGHAWHHEEPVLLVGETGCGKTTAVEIISKIIECPLYSLSCHNNTESADFLGGLRPDRAANSGMLFQWVDGPLVQAMRAGGVFLADEISLADDSVLERMNSVLEPEREILLAEKIGQEMGSKTEVTTEIIKAEPGFRFVGTMNPGGDYGKKELSLALRNRFSEIWCPALNSREDLVSIVNKNITDSSLTENIVEFVCWLQSSSSVVVSIRDVLSWVHFINTASSQGLSASQCLWEGAHLVWLDGLQIEGATEIASIHQIQKEARKQLETICGNVNLCNIPSLIVDHEDSLTIGPFSLRKSPQLLENKVSKYSFQSQTISDNIRKIIRALQISKPTLLEGSPGIGKTSLVEALASRLNRKLTRINLSDQTDIADLFGADLPVEGGEAGHFEWRNGPFLNAMENGEWILLDELNLASQSILEGLNAVFDHRNEVFIPELNRTFPLHPETKIFACQNPISEGGDRKGLPKSFLNRFSKIFMSGLCCQDFIVICQSLYPDIDQDTIVKMVQFSSTLEDQIIRKKSWGQSGSPWEFNLRDLLRWCQAVQSDQDKAPGKWVNIIYKAKMRTAGDRDNVSQLFRDIFEPKDKLVSMTGNTHLSLDKLYVGHFCVGRQSAAVSGDQSGQLLLSCQSTSLEMMAGCVSQGWPVLLTGPSQAGKTALVHTLASLAATQVDTVSLNTSTDTMELLGGFEQSDVERSLGDLWTRVRVWIMDITQHLMSGSKVEDGLLFMQRYLQLEQAYKDASLKRRRGDQLKILSEVILSVRSTNAAISECEQFLMELGKLDEVQQGTFEWIDSLLVRAMEQGNWLVLDGANTCSASVLDRLNSVLEDGGRLVVSERGVLGGDIVTVKKHPDFRAFIIYDPIKGEISRAMRNRCVEIYVDNESITLEDTKHLANSVLGPASASNICKVETAKLLSRNPGFQTLINHLTLLRHDTLAGGLVTDENMTSLDYDSHKTVSSSLLATLGNTSIASVDVSLFNILHQMRPVVNIASTHHHLVTLAIQRFLSCQNSQTRDKSIKMISLLLGFHLEDLQDMADIGCDTRMLPVTFHQHSMSSHCNQTVVAFSVMIGLKNLIGNAAQQQESLINVGELCNDSLILKQYPEFLSNALNAIVSDVAKLKREMSDEDWDMVDNWLDHLAHFISLGQGALTRDNADMVARNIAVHWSWLFKLANKWIQDVKFQELQMLLENFNKTVLSSIPMSSKSMKKLRNMLECSPLPPSSHLESRNLVQAKELEKDPMMTVLLHQINFAAKYESVVKGQISLLKHGKSSVEDVLSVIKGSVLTYKDIAESQENIQVTPEQYLDIQLCSVKECLARLFATTCDHPLMSLRHRIHHADPRTHPALSFVLDSLGNYEGRGVKMLETIDYDPVLMKVSAKEDPVPIPYNLLHVVSSVAKAADISIALADEKETQLKELKDHLAGSISMTKCDNLRNELFDLIKALVKHLKLNFTDDLAENLKALSSAPVVFEGFAALVTELLKLHSDLDEKCQMSKLRLELFLNILKLHLFSMVGIIDPAEKQVIKKELSQAKINGVKEKMIVLARFNDILGANHPHFAVLEKRKDLLADDIQRRVVMTAVRDPQENFNSLSKDLSHFSKTIGNVDNVVHTFSMVCDGNINLADSWTASTVNFIKTLLNYSTFQDLVIPVCESAIRLVNVINEAKQHYLSQAINKEVLNAESLFLKAGSKFPDPKTTILNFSRFFLNGDVMSLFEGKDKLVLLESSLAIFKSSHLPDHGGDIILKITDSLLQLWREDEAAKEKLALEAESMYKTKTVKHEDEDDDGVVEEEFQSLFPSFAEIFSDLSPNYSLESTELRPMKAPDGPLPRQRLNETLLILVNTLLKKDCSSRESLSKSFEARLASLLNVIKDCPGLLSENLEKCMIPNLVSLVATLTSQEDQEKSKKNFFKDPDREQTSQVRPLLEKVEKRILELLVLFPENPILLQVLKTKARVLSQPWSAPIPRILTGMELVLSSCQEWEKNAHKGVSIQSEMEEITNVILSWRRLELASLKSLLADHLDLVRDQTITKFWLHVVSITFERKNKKEEVVRSLVRFMEAGSIGDFQARLDILLSTVQLLSVTKCNSKVLSVLVNLHTYYTDLNLGVDKALKRQFYDADAKLKDLLKFAKWKDTNFWSVKTVMDKTKKALHKVLREFQKSISLPCNDFFKEEQLDANIEREEDNEFVMPARASRTLTTLENIVLTSKGIELGSLVSLDKKLLKWEGKAFDNLESEDFVTDMKNLLPEVVEEMEKLRSLTVNRSLSEEEQKKQAGFIQQRKRMRLNDLFKTLQKFGFSYRFGVTNCEDVNNNDEMYKHLDTSQNILWVKSEKYFFRCFSRFRHLLSLLDRAPPQDIGCNLNERFQGFVQHMLKISRNWRKVTIDFSKALSDVEKRVQLFGDASSHDLTNSGTKFKSLLTNCYETVETVCLLFQHRCQEYSEIPELKDMSGMCEDLKELIRNELDKTQSVFAPSNNKSTINKISSSLVSFKKLLSKVINDQPHHILFKEWNETQQKLELIRNDIDNWTMQKPFRPHSFKPREFQDLCHKLVTSSMVGVQDVYKRSGEYSNKDLSWLQKSNVLLDMMKCTKLDKFDAKVDSLLQFLGSEAGLSNIEASFKLIQNYVMVSEGYLDLSRSLAAISLHGLLNFNKFLSVTIKVFSEIMTNGFCPVKDLDDGPSKTSNEFKSSEEETGLGDGEGSKDVSDQIDNEDMLDGAYQNQEDANDNEDKDNKEEDNGIEMSENFESNLQEKEEKDQEEDSEENEDNSKELEDEKGDVDNDENIDKDMWGDEDENDSKDDLEDEGDEGQSTEDKMEELSAKEDNEKSDEKRQRKEEKSEENPEFDDDQTDNVHGEDKQFPEPEAFDLPDNMDLDEVEKEDNFEEPDNNDPEVQPDFEQENNDEDGDEDDIESGNPDVVNFEDDEDHGQEGKEDVEKAEDEEDPSMEVDQEVDNSKETESGMDVDDSSDQKAVDAANDQDPINQEQSSDGLNSQDLDSKSKDSFGVTSENKENNKDEETGSGDRSESEKSLAENTEKAEKLDIIEGAAVEDSNMGDANIFQHVANEKETDKTAIDKAEEKDKKEQIVPENFEEDDENRKQPQLMKEEHEEKKDSVHESQGKQSELKAETNDDHQKMETEGDVVSTYNVSRGNESLISQGGHKDNGFPGVSTDQDVSMSLDAIQLSDSTNVDTPVMTQLSHQLCEQLRLILEPTKASKLQGDFKTGKRLNMRKIIPYIASQFKKDKIWLRRVKPNKREFQILVALDDSSSMSDNESREMALSSLNTLSSALTLLEVGQLGVLRFGKSAEVVHGLGSQWSQTAGAKIQNQFTFEQKETSLLSLLSLSTQLFMKHSSSRSRNLSVSQLLVIVSDGRGVFHEGKEKVLQAVRRARQAGYFCLFLIVENPNAKDSVLDIRQPVFSGGKLVCIDSYMEHFPFDHYIVLRDVNNLPRTLSDALRQWFELVIS